MRPHGYSLSDISERQNIAGNLVFCLFFAIAVFPPSFHSEPRL